MCCCYCWYCLLFCFLVCCWVIVFRGGGGGGGGGFLKGGRGLFVIQYPLKKKNQDYQKSILFACSSTSKITTFKKINLKKWLASFFSVYDMVTLLLVNHKFREIRPSLKYSTWHRHKIHLISAFHLNHCAQIKTAWVHISQPEGIPSETEAISLETSWGVQNLFWCTVL